MAYFSISLTVGSSSFGPSEQFTPSASTPKDESATAAVFASVPRKVLPSLSKVMVAAIGKSEFSFAARIAALISSKSDMVSIIMRSAPASAPNFTCEAKMSYASSKVSEPMGSSKAPIGPISSAAYFAPERLTAAIPAFMTSSTFSSLPSFFLFAPKVFAVIMSEPASTNFLCIAVTISGCVRLKLSGSSPDFKPLFCSMVPMPPSVI